MYRRSGACVAIPTYNGWRRVKNLLENLRQRTGLTVPHDVVVCDDSGKHDHRELVKKICQEYGAQYVEHAVNRGVAASWNTLVRSTDREMVALLNDDVLVARNWLDYLYYAVMENPKVGSFSLPCYFIAAEDAFEIVKAPDASVVPLNVRYESGVLIRNERFRSMPEQKDDQPGKVMCPAGCLFGFQRETWELVDGFDSRYFAFYEETDFGVSCAYRGMPAFTLPAPHDNYHLWSATFGSAPEIPAGQIMIDSRNRFVEKWSGILGVRFQDAPEIHSLLMDKIAPFPVRWLGPDKSKREAIL